MRKVIGLWLQLSHFTAGIVASFFLGWCGAILMFLGGLLTRGLAEGVIWAAVGLWSGFLGCLICWFIFSSIIQKLRGSLLKGPVG